ncbi:hypothetical protein CC1G_10373 [Coprinopsis cinerea okayama7|uniref:Uncharacterized protein n=1 Tax=Coprinopsis cinerea (strain Okayama-7 / 130 / ATCC MYA-4618 / FGSC 9003) TaxID=240176 RepID=A8PEA7_COPC7|nr:hypothetical protein CC1G_10373 [Coprinopsis cinerea okayama7\|eukprot:XP_001840759.2 hypothetical protein CC1G_10373 [Coprinopsis cinerea okayama7\
MPSVSQCTQVVRCVTVFYFYLSEERPGHPVKLYQYCSGDVQDIVQRHITFDGERDTKGVADFGANPSRPDDGDDDDADDDDDAPTKSGKRSRNEPSGRLKLPTDFTGGSTDDYVGHRTIPMTQHMQSGPSSGPGLPISTLRSSTSGGGGGPGPSSSSYGRRPSGRGNPSRSPSDDPAHGPSSYPYHPAPPSSFSRGGGGYGGPQQGGGGGGGGGYQQFYNTPPQQSFMPLPSDFPPRGGSGGMSRGSGSHGNFPRGSGSFEPGMYQSQSHAAGMMRQSSSSSGGANTGSDNLFSFLDSDDGHNPRQSNANPNAFSLDWPVGPNSATGSSTSSSSARTGAPPPSVSPGSGGQDWLEFLAGNPNNAAREGSGAHLSWERGGPGGGSTDRTTATDLADLFAAATATGPTSPSHRRGSPHFGSGSGGSGGSKRMRDMMDDGRRQGGLNALGGGPPPGMAGASRTDLLEPKLEHRE